MHDPYLDKLLNSKKYRDVCPDAVRRVYAECLVRYKKPKDAEKAAREALHGITGAFNGLDSRALQKLSIQDDAALSELLSRHASTRERLPLAAMDALYARIFEVTGPPGSILDLACGLNPVYLIRRFPGAGPVVGIDISVSCVGLIDALGAEGSRGICADLLNPESIPGERFQMALLFKILPLLERQRAGTAMDVMRHIDAQFLIVSFPTRTLGGRNVGMEGNYSDWMERHMPPDRAIADRFTTDNELIYILRETTSPSDLGNAPDAPSLSTE